MQQSLNLLLSEISTKVNFLRIHFREINYFTVAFGNIDTIYGSLGLATRKTTWKEA